MYCLIPNDAIRKQQLPFLLYFIPVFCKVWSCWSIFSEIENIYNEMSIYWFPELRIYEYWIWLLKTCVSLESTAQKIGLTSKMKEGFSVYWHAVCLEQCLVTYSVHCAVWNMQCGSQCGWPTWPTWKGMQCNWVNCACDTPQNQFRMQWCPVVCSAFLESKAMQCSKN